MDIILSKSMEKYRYEKNIDIIFSMYIIFEYGYNIEYVYNFWIWILKI